MQAATTASIQMTVDAWVRLTDLRAALTAQEPLTSPDLQRTMGAVRNQLLISPEQHGQAGFLSMLNQAIRIVERNLAIKSTSIRWPQRQSPCTPNAFALAHVSPFSWIRCCDKFFAATTSAQCQRNVITHERFHLAGLHHGQAGARSEPALITTPAQALDSADNLMDLVKEVTREPLRAC